MSAGIAAAVGKRRHDAASDDSDPCPPKRWYYVLASESDQDTDGTESICSLQEKSTDFAKDTSDTSTKSSWSMDDEGRMIEFEIVSYSEEQSNNNPFESNDSSSSPVDLRPNVLEVNPGFSTSEVSADNSNTNSEEESFSTSCKNGFYKYCFQCKEVNQNPCFRYCNRCYKLRKQFWPPRPKGARKKKVNDLEKYCNNSVDSGVGTSSSQSLQEASNEVKTDVDLCNICLVRPKDGGYFHRGIVHIYSCYKCSIKIYKRTGQCPICNTKVWQVCKLIK